MWTYLAILLANRIRLYNYFGPFQLRVCPAWAPAATLFGVPHYTAMKHGLPVTCALDLGA